MLTQKFWKDNLQFIKKSCKETLRMVSNNQIKVFVCKKVLNIFGLRFFVVFACLWTFCSHRTKEGYIVGLKTELGPNDRFELKISTTAARKKYTRREDPKNKIFWESQHFGIVQVYLEWMVYNSLDLPLFVQFSSSRLISLFWKCRDSKKYSCNGQFQVV